MPIKPSNTQTFDRVGLVNALNIFRFEAKFEVLLPKDFTQRQSYAGQRGTFI